MINLAVGSISVHTSKECLTCLKILRHGASGVASYLKGGVLRIWIALKNPSPCTGFAPANLRFGSKQTNPFTSENDSSRYTHHEFPIAVIHRPVRLKWITAWTAPNWCAACSGRVFHALCMLSASVFYRHLGDDAGADFAIVEGRVENKRPVWWNREKSVSKWDSIILKPARQRGLFACVRICEVECADFSSRCNKPHTQAAMLIELCSV
jgi:hypothetical protein